MCKIEFERLIGPSVTLMPVTWWFFCSSLDTVDYVHVHFFLLVMLSNKHVTLEWISIFFFVDRRVD